MMNNCLTLILEDVELKSLIWSMRWSRVLGYLGCSLPR